MTEPTWVKRWGDELAPKPELPGVWRRRAGGFRIRGRVNNAQTGRLHEVNRALSDVSSARQAFRALQDELESLRTKLAAAGRPIFADYSATVFVRKCQRGAVGEPRRGVITSKAGKVQWELVLRLHLIPAFGTMRVDEIRRRHVQEWLDGIPLLQPNEQRRWNGKTRKLESGYQARSVNGWLRILRTILSEAAREFEIAMPNLEDLELPEAPAYTEENSNSLKPVDVPRFLAAMRKNYPQHYAMTLTGFVTGLRPSSLRPLRRRGDDSDVKWDGAVLLVRRSHARGEDVMASTKTGKRQAIQLPTELLDVLKWHTDTQLETNEQRDSDLLFPGLDGSYRSRSALDGPFEVCSKAIGLRYVVTPRAMRRTFQDLARAAEVHDLVTRSISGHATEDMQRHYSTVQATEQRSALAKVISLATYRDELAAAATAGATEPASAESNQRSADAARGGDEGGDAAKVASTTPIRRARQAREDQLGFARTRGINSAVECQLPKAKPNGGDQ